MSSEFHEQHRGPTRSSEGEDGTGSVNVFTGNAKKRRAQILMHILSIYILEMAQFAGTSFCNDIVAILRDPDLDLTVFITKIEDVEGYRLTKLVSLDILDFSIHSMYESVVGSSIPN